MKTTQNLQPDRIFYNGNPIAMVVLESDPFAGDILAVKDIDVMETIAGGKTVYRKSLAFANQVH